jgi:hypothetical protein
MREDRAQSGRGAVAQASACVVSVFTRPKNPQAEEVAEKGICTVIPSEARNLSSI